MIVVAIKNTRIKNTMELIISCGIKQRDSPCFNILKYILRNLNKTKILQAVIWQIVVYCA